MNPNTLLFYAKTISPRLKYIAETLLIDHLGLQVVFTTDSNVFYLSTQPKLQYDNSENSECVSIGTVSFLFEKNIEKPKLDYALFKSIPIIFYKGIQYSLPFDVFAASFFFLSRYEEYLPHTPDLHGRYRPEESWAFQNKCLNQPLVDFYSMLLKNVLHEKYPALQFKNSTFQFLPTYDIDWLFRFQGRGAARNFFSFFKYIIKNKKNELHLLQSVLLRKQPDPFNTFSVIKEWHKKYNLKGIFFFLLSDYSQYDTNVSYKNKDLQHLISLLFKTDILGIHPSYASHKNLKKLNLEISRLQQITQSEVKHSRQHFLKFKLPDTFENLINYGIEHDYSMGYASYPGFRAGSSKPFYFYNLLTETKTRLIIHPISFMDATFDFYLKKSDEASLEIIFNIIRQIKKVNGTCISLFHNNSFQDFETPKNWKSDYEKIIQFCAQ